MTATLPSDLRDVFTRCTVAELVTIDGHGRPVAHAVVPAYRPGGPCIDVAVGAPDVEDPHVALLFAGDGPMVLVQGTAQLQDVLHVRPERVYAWASDDPEAEPRLFDARGGVLRLPRLPVGMPVEPGPACLHATVRGPRVHGDLVTGPDGWSLVPHAVLDA